ncbi:MAG: nitrate reductase [Chloroflexi bacterium]|nr:nitrate reductase [Chloroflexota bacterium]
MKRFARTPQVVVGLLVAVAVALSFNGSALAQQVPTVSATHVQRVSADPFDPSWSTAPLSVVPLTSQMVALPRLATPSVSTVYVRALNDGERIGFRLDWDDPTRDAHALQPTEFRDAAAVMLAAPQGTPNICMGSPGQVTNLWHWKADWQEDLDKGYQEVVDAYPNFFKDYYPFVTGTPPYRMPVDFASPDAKRYIIGQAAGNPMSQPARTTPVEEMLSAGFGTTTHRAQQTVEGKGVWTNGHWQVTFVRPLATTGAEAASLANEKQAPVAFAVWNGSNAEVGARKQLSGMATVRILPPEVPAPPPAAPQPITSGAAAWEWWHVAVGLSIVGLLVAMGVLGESHGRRWARRSERRDDDQ